MSRPGLNYPNWMDLGNLTYFVHDNFDDIVLATGLPRWTADGTLTKSTSKIGTPLIATTAGATDNDNAGVLLATKPMQFSDSKPFYMRAAYLFTEASVTANTNGCIGVTDQTGDDNVLADNGGGPLSTSDAAMFYFKDGSPNLWVWASNGSGFNFNEELKASNRNNKSGVTWVASSSSERIFEIESKPLRTGYTEVMFKINGELVASAVVPTASAAMMGPVLHVKCGTNTAAQAFESRFCQYAQNY